MVCAPRAPKLLAIFFVSEPGTEGGAMPLAKTIGFRGSNADRQRLEAEAKAQDVSLSEYIRRRLRN